MVGDMVANSTIVISTPTMMSPRPGTPLPVEACEDARKHAVVSRRLGRLPDEQHPATERSHRLQDRAHADDDLRRSGRSRAAPLRRTARATCCSSSFGMMPMITEELEHVHDRRQAEANERGKRNVALRVLDDPGGDRRALDAHVGPQRHRCGA